MKIRYNNITPEGIVIILILLLSVVLFHYRWKMQKNDQIENEFQTARSVAASLPKELIDSLGIDTTDVKKTEYRILRNRLTDIAALRANTRFAYIYTLNNGNLYFIAGSDTAVSNNYAHCIRQSPKVFTAFVQAYTDGRGLVAGPWNNWRSALVPLKNGHTGRTIAVFGMDFKVRVWNGDLWYQMAELAGLLLLLLLAMLFWVSNSLGNKSLQVEIEERSRVEKTLIENKERLYSLFHNAPLSYQSLDAIGNIFDVNQQWIDTFGYALDEVLGKWFGSFLSPAYQAGFRKQFFDIKDNSHFHIDLEMVHKNGRTMFVALEGKVGHYLNGAFRQANCILQDITERKQTKDELALSLSLLNASLEAASDGIIIIDRQGKEVLHNQKFADMWRVPNEILAQRSNGNLLNYIVSQTINSGEFLTRRKELSEQPGETGTMILNLTDGRIFECYSQPQRIGEEVVGRIWSFRDITGRRLTELALRQSEGRYYSVIAHIPEVIVFLDTQGIIKYYSPNMERIFGWQPGELEETNIRDAVHPDDTDRIRGKFFTIVEKDYSSKTGEYRLRCRDGRYRYIELTGVNLTNDSYISGILMSFHDITAYTKLREEILIAKEKPEEGNWSKSDSVAGLGHEILPPLNGIISFAELMNDPNINDEDRREYAWIIKKSGTRMLEIIKGMINGSKTESGQSQPHEN
jgi:PAS domain S-box-containing protein